MFKPGRIYKIIITVVILLSGAIVERVSAGPLYIENWDFEAIELLDGKSGTVWNIPGWDMDTTTGTFGVWNPSITAFHQDYEDGNVAWINSGYIAQVLPYDMAAGSLYTLTVDVGYQQASSCSTCTSYGYTIELLSGGDLLNTYSGTGTAGEWDTVSLIYSASANGGPLEIRLHTSGKRSHFDNVRLSNTAVPEPSTFMLLGSGLLGLAGFGRKWMPVQ